MSLDLNQISPGVRRLVGLLNEHGFETTDSGDGSLYRAGMECAVPFSMVAIKTTPERLVLESERLMHLLWIICRGHIGLKGFSLEASYSPLDKQALIVLTDVCDDDLIQMVPLSTDRAR